jgi:acetylornithine aminotransferase
MFEVYPLFDVTPVKGKDVYVYDQNNVKYLDLYGGHAVISIGHAHPTYVSAITDQIQHIGFYSNAVKNPLQIQLANKLENLSNCKDYQLFLCNSGAEANENALKLASFLTGKSKVLAFKNAFHGRTSASVAATDNSKIVSPLNAQHQVDFVKFGNLEAIEIIFKQQETCAVIIEPIQGVGGLDEACLGFFKGLENLCKTYDVCLIADEVQSGFGRSGDFFAFQKYSIQPDIISMAKGMGNGFPIGGIFIQPNIKASYGLLGTTFGGNHLACRAALAVLEVIEKQNLMQNVTRMSDYFKNKSKSVKGLKAFRGRGLMLGLEFDYPVSELRKRLLYNQKIFTGSSKNPNLIRVLPPLTVKEKHWNQFFKALQIELDNILEE